MTPKAKAILAWLATLAWAAEIYWSSTRMLGSSRTRSWLARLLASLDLRLSPDAQWSLHLVLRKGAHCFEYGVFAALLFHALTAHFQWRRPLAAPAPRKVALGSLAVAAFYAATDEFHQLFVAGRGASLGDWAIDVAAAALALAWLARPENRPRSGVRLLAVRKETASSAV